MTYRKSSSSSCFERLGINVPFSDTRSFGQSISVTDVKQAYRRLALKTHPDKVPINQKEQASAHFRELHEAYEEALSIILNHESDRDNDSNINTESDRDSDSDKYSQSGFDVDHDSDNDDEEDEQETKDRNTKSYYSSDDDIKKAFEDISKDLDSAYETKCQKAEENCYRCVEAAWASNDKEKSWTLMRKVSLDFRIPILAKDFETRSDKLSGLTVYVEERATRVTDERTISVNKRTKDVVERINREWPHRAESLKEWMMEKVCVLQFDEIAILVQDPNAARSILVWEKEKWEEINRSVAIHQQEIADQIVKVFPDKIKMECIIEKNNLHFKILRNPIYELLPEDIRRTLTTDINAENKVEVDTEVETHAATEEKATAEPKIEVETMEMEEVVTTIKNAVDFIEAKVIDATTKAIDVIEMEEVPEVVTVIIEAIYYIEAKAIKVITKAVDVIGMKVQKYL